MTLTLSNCIERINQALDYPALEYTDISHYFDQAIAELNSTLRIGIRPVTQLLAGCKFDLGKQANLVALDREPTPSESILCSESEPDNTVYYYNSSTHKFGVKRNDEWHYYNNLYGYLNTFQEDVSRIYTTLFYSDDMVYWVPFNDNPLELLDLTEYLPVDVIILFVLPYVCFKFTVRDGGDGQLFREEFIQGFQQIQTSYDIPNTVNLVRVAGKKAYVEDVKNNVGNLNVYVPTRAIYDSMKIGNAIMPTYGGFYEDGGWGI